MREDFNPRFREEATRDTARLFKRAFDFNPRFREEATRKHGKIPQEREDFNPRFREEATATRAAAFGRSAHFNPRFREEATSRHGERMSAFFVQTAEKCSAFARNKGEWAGKIEISGGFSPVLECEPDGGTMNAYGSHRGCGVSMGRLSRGSLLCYSGRLELRGGTNEGSGLECFGVFFGGRRRTRVRGGIGGRGDLFAVKQKGF